MLVGRSHDKTISTHLIELACCQWNTRRGPGKRLTLRTGAHEVGVEQREMNRKTRRGSKEWEMERWNGGEEAVEVRWMGGGDGGSVE